VAADARGALVERRRRDPDGEGAQPRPPALEALGEAGPGIGAEIRDLELEPIDDDGADGQVREREPAGRAERVERER